MSVSTGFCLLKKVEEILEKMNEHVQKIRYAIRAADGEALKNILSESPELLFAEEPELAVLVTLALLFLDRVSEASSVLPFCDVSRLEGGKAVGDGALLHFLLGQGDSALELIREAVRLEPEDAVLWARFGAIATALGKLDEAEKAYERALALEPDPRAELLNNVAALKLRQGRLNEAIEYYDRALAKKPDLEITARQRLLALANIGRGEEVLSELEEALNKNPDEPSAHRRLAEAQALLGNRDAAIATLLAACDRLPEEHTLKIDAARLLLAEKRVEEAGRLLKGWLEEGKEIPPEIERELRILLNEARIEAGFYETAEKDIEELLEDDPNGEVRILKARLLNETGRAEEAVPILEEVVSALPGRLDAVLQLSHVLTSLGRLEQAKRYLSQVEAAAPALLINKIEANEYEASSEEKEALERLFANPILPPEQRANVGFCLYRVRLKRGEDREAFSALKAANDLIKARINYDWRVHRRLIEETLEVFTPELVERLEGKGHPSKRPIFVVGMPRSGTTLTEQILGAHPQCCPRGELPWVARITRLMPKALGTGTSYPRAMLEMTPQDLYNAGAYYLEKAGAGVDESLRVVDKMPHNFDYVGLIALMFPKAAIIHVDRDPLDNALSNYEQNFAAAHGLMGFAFDLEWIGEMLVDHAKIMEHWYSLFPGRIFRLSYEKLVSEPESTIKELLDFCGLPWDDSVMKYTENPVAVRTASVRQVRKEIYTESKAKWRRFEEELRPVREILARGFKSVEELSGKVDVVVPLGLWGVTR